MREVDGETLFKAAERGFDTFQPMFNRFKNIAREDAQKIYDFARSKKGSYVYEGMEALVEQRYPDMA